VVKEIKLDMYRKEENSTERIEGGAGNVGGGGG
jgi:hypothetical protein